jgi:hypothetical protein
MNNKSARNNSGGAVFEAIECLVFTPRGGENLSYRRALTPNGTADFPGGGLGVSPFAPPPPPGSIRAHPCRAARPD